MTEMVAVDILVVPTIRFRLLYVFVILSHARRRVVHFNVTANPTAAWTAQQIVDAFPWDTAPRYLLRDRDSIYGEWYRQRVKSMGIEEVVTAYLCPWQNPYVERLHGNIRRECTNLFLANATCAESFSLISTTTTTTENTWDSAKKHRWVVPSQFEHLRLIAWSSCLVLEDSIAYSGGSRPPIPLLGGH